MKIYYKYIIVSILILFSSQNMAASVSDALLIDRQKPQNIVINNGSIIISKLLVSIGYKG